MLILALLCCLLGLSCYQYSSDQRVDQVNNENIQETKTHLNEISYSGFDNYSISNLGFNENSIHILFDTYDSTYVPWQYDGLTIRSFQNDLSNFAWGDSSGGIYSNSYTYDFIGKVGVLYNYDLEYDQAIQPISSQRENIVLTYMTKLKVSVIKYNSLNMVAWATNGIVIQTNNTGYLVQFDYYCNDLVFLTQYFQVILPISYQPEYKIYSLVPMDLSGFVNIANLNSRINTSYTGAFPLSPLTLSEHTYTNQFSLLLKNSTKNGQLITSGFDGTTKTLDNLIFSLNSDIDYLYGYNRGVDQVDTDYYTEVYNNGYNIGYQDAEDIEWSNGFDLGWDSGYAYAGTPGTDIYDRVYDIGYNDGYNAGGELDATALAIMSGIIDIGLLPVNVFLQIFNFEVFGINIAGMVSALLTIAVTIIIIRFTLGRKE